VLLSERLASIAQPLASLAPQLVTVDFGPWLPDLPTYANPGVTVAKNVIPGEASYRPVLALGAATAALTARCRGATAARDSSGNNYNYAGDATKLYEVAAAGVTDKSSATYTTASDDVWEFALFGSLLLATNYADAVQEITVGEAGNFANLITSTLKPTARHIATVRNFVVLGNTNDGTDGAVPHRVWWSGFNDATDFDPDATTQCDYEDRPDAGWVQRIVGGAEYALVFQQRAITRMAYAGPPTIFQFDDIDRKRGTPIPNSVIGHGRFVYFISEEGFFVTDGTQSYPIGVGQVDRTFWNQFDIGNAHLVSAAIDPVNKIVAWAFPGAGAAGAANKVYFYNWDRRRWSEADIDLEILANTTSEAYTLEGLDAVALDSTADTTLDANEIAAQTELSVADETVFDVGDTVRVTLNDASIHQADIASIGTGTITIDVGLPSAADSGNRVVRTSMDAMTVSLDSPQWQGGGTNFGAFDTSHKLAYFDGDALAVTIETGDIELFPGRVARVSSLRPLIDGGTTTTQIASRATLQGAVSYATAESLDDIGDADHLVEARYHRFRCSVAAAGSWNHAQGVQIAATPMGDK